MTAATDLSRLMEARNVANVEAEQALLGAILYDNDAVRLCGDFLRGEHFAEPAHGWIFDKAREAVAAGRLVDPITIHDAATSAGGEAYQQLGGLGYLATMFDRAPPARNAPDYAAVIFEAAVRRGLVRACQEGAQAAIGDREASAFALAAELRHKLEALENDAAPDDASMVEAPAAADHAIARMQEIAAHGRPRGRMTGLRCIDRRLGGLKPGALIVIGGRPGMAKTALARAIAHGAAVRSPEADVLFLGIEMGPEEMVQRELSALTHEHGEGIEYRAMGSGSLTPMDFQVMDAVRGRVPRNLIFDDCHSLSLDDVRRKIWSRRRRGRTLGAVVIDYLQLMRKPAAQGRNEASVLGEMTAGLKLIARQAETCIVLLSQLSRAVEARDDKRPQLSDLRDSGSIEQDADAVLFPFREHYYLSRGEPKAGTDRHLEWEMKCADTRTLMEVICAKQRQGPVGVDRQRYLPEYDHIEDERDHP